MLFLFVVVLSVGVLVPASFYLGRKYGSEVEAKAIAAAMKVAFLVREDYRSVVADIKVKETAALARIKKYL